MVGWMVGWMDGWTDGWMVSSVRCASNVDRWRLATYSGTHLRNNEERELINGWTDGWMDGWMGGWMDGRMDGWMD